MNFVSRFSYLLRCELNEYRNKHQMFHINYVLRCLVANIFSLLMLQKVMARSVKNLSLQTQFRAGEKCLTCKNSRQVDAEAF